MANLNKDVSLPKWPAMVVRGQRVTREQAAEIIVRTARWPVSSNSHAFDQQANEAAGFHGVPSWREPYNKNESDAERLARFKAERKKESDARDALGVLGVEYLHNDRISSAYIGGPHGWCDWDGDIFTDSYNIGKWPSVESVTSEWAEIAMEWPFLDLTCQLFSGEQCEDGIVPLVEFGVSDGEVIVRPPTPGLGLKPTDREFDPMSFMNPTREIGTTIQNLEWAVRVTREALKKKVTNA